jgi:long-subunit acyl-CoA synthetase (AMP-forming)
MNPPERLNLSSVGVFLDGVEGRIADDGEVLIRRRNLFSGYLSGLDATEDPVADGRRFVAVVVGLDEDELLEFAAARGLDGDGATLSAHPSVRAEIVRGVQEANAHLPKAARTRDVVIADRVWRPGGPEITRTMKLRRSVVLEQYAERIDELYR